MVWSSHLCIQRLLAVCCLLLGVLICPLILPISLLLLRVRVLGLRRCLCPIPPVLISLLVLRPLRYVSTLLPAPLSRCR